MAGYEKITLEKMKFAIMSRWTEEMFACRPEVDVSTHVAFMADELCVRLRVGILGKQHEKLEFQYPDNWWQAVRERFAPKWWLKRWPVQYRKRVLDVKELFPKMAIPDGVYHVDFAMMRPGDLDVWPPRAPK